LAGRNGGPRRVAIVGKPNVGKSSLLNKIAGQQRAVVDEVAGTTVDPVDELVELSGEIYRFVDTAGIRRRVKEASGHEYYASLRTHGAIERAEVCIVVVDASEPVTEQDLRILTSVEEAGRALVIAFNKWDLVDEERQHYLTREIERDLVQVQWAPRINVTARTGWHVDRLVPALDRALEGWETRIGTGALNSFLGRLVAEHPHPVRGGKQPKIMFATQPSTAPLPLPMRTSGGREVIGLCGKMRIQTLPLRLSKRLMAIRQASIWWLVIHARSRVCRPKSPKATVVPTWALPERLPRWLLRNLVRLGIKAIAQSFVEI